MPSLWIYQLYLRQLSCKAGSCLYRHLLWSKGDTQAKILKAANLWVWNAWHTWTLWENEQLQYKFFWKVRAETHAYDKIVLEKPSDFCLGLWRQMESDIYLWVRFIFTSYMLIFSLLFFKYHHLPLPHARGVLYMRQDISLNQKDK